MPPSKTDYIMIAIGALGALLITSYIPTTVATMSSSIKSSGCSKCSQLSLDKISGIDTKALEICRQKGLM